MDMALKKAPSHRYQQLLDELLLRIEAGVYPVGSFLPTENQLCQEFGISRFTAREALRRMTEMGMVVRQPRQGTRLVSDKPATAYVQPLDSMDEVMVHVRDTKLNIVAVEIVSADDSLAAELQCEPGQNWLHVCGCRQARGEDLPLSWTDIYVAERYSGIVDDVGESDEPMFRLIEKRYGERIAEIEQDISATTVSPTMALALRVRPNSPALLVNRRSYNNKRGVIEISINTQPSLRYTYKLRVKHNGMSVREDVNTR